MSNDKDRVKKQRKKMMLDQQEFAAEMGVHRETVSKWERGIQRLKARHLRILARLEEKGR